MTMNAQPVIQIENINRHYQSGDTVVKALDDVSLTIHQGEFVAIMGQSGSGKTTLMNILGCLDRPTSGSYRIRGREAAALEADELAELRRETFGFIFQRYNLLASSSAEENVEIPALYAGMGKGTRRARARGLLGSLGLGERCDHRPSQLSGGQQQRVAIARALMNDPPVILADEPTGALDSRSGEEVMALLKKLNGEGRTIIIITHDEHVANHTDRIIRIQDGRIIDDSATAAGPAPSRAPADAPHALHDRHAGLFAETQESVITALRALRVNFFRTALTLLGIIIGVAAVVTMMAVGNGSKRAVLEQISALGTNLLSVLPGAPGMRSSGDNATLLLSDADALQSLPNIALVVPERSGRKTVRFGNTDYSTSIEAVGAGFSQARDWQVSRGTFFTDRDQQSYAPVAVLGKTVAGILFPHDEPLGKFILIGNVPFQVIGVLAEKGASWGRDQDDTVMVPVTTGITRLFGGRHLSAITLRVGSTEALDQTEALIKSTLTARHGTENFSVRNMASFLEMATQAQSTLTILLGAVAAISLLVGGIGVMNTMLVSVTERTREIGIRMATGARRRDIMIQFITEAAVVCTIGGMLGVALGFATGFGLSFAGVDIVFSAAPALMAFSCAVLTGLIFGYLPAHKAARLDPVIALSSE